MLIAEFCCKCYTPGRRILFGELGSVIKPLYDKYNPGPAKWTPSQFSKLQRFLHYDRSQPSSPRTIDELQRFLNCNVKQALHRHLKREFSCVEGILIAEMQ